MKKSLLLMVIAFITGIVTASATCWRINPSPYAGAQFKTVEDAMNDINVLPGDTLMLDPGNHGSIELKRNNLTIIGTGYFLDRNTDWAESQQAIVGTLYLSDGCKAEGILASSIATDENCIVSRCKTDEIYSLSGGSNVRIEGCIIGQCNPNYSSNWIIRNNIMTNCRPGNEGHIIENNTVICNEIYSYGINAKNSTIRNNIVINTAEGFDSDNIPYSAQRCINFDPSRNNVIQDNVLSIPERFADKSYTNNYFIGATIENTFINEGSDDAKWQLLETSAAKGAATHGGDCGAFGGPTPYVLSGIPQFLPHITEALIPAKPTDGKITVKLKIANQNE